MGHVTLHAGTSEPRPLPVDAVAVPVRTAHGASRLAGWGGPHRMAVVPLEIARGVQNKVLEAMAMALPVVLTSSAATGMTRLSY